MRPGGSSPLTATPDRDAATTQLRAGVGAFTKGIPRPLAEMGPSAAPDCANCQPAVDRLTTGWRSYGS